MFSGGVDSTVALWELQRRGEKVRCLGVNYGQRHADRELAAAATIAGRAGCPFEVADISAARPLFGANALTDPDVPLPTGEDQSLTVVPNRNMVLLSIGAAYALAGGDDGLAYGAHLGDREVYADCRVEWVEKVRSLLRQMGLRLEAPLLAMSKAGVLQHGKAMGAPLSLTWTCYAGGEKACGQCGSCRAKHEAWMSIS
jgi:7-cyano-7-deazaguanine synthase